MTRKSQRTTSKLKSDYYQRLVYEYGVEKADKFWSQRNNQNINFNELGKALTEYLSK